MAAAVKPRRARGERIDDAIPDTAGHRSISNPYPSFTRKPSKPVSDYWHRLMYEGKRKPYACDCGAEFDTAVDLAWHQNPYRHPRLAWDKR